MPKQIDFPQVLQKLKTFHFKHKRVPSFSEFQTLFGYRSKGGVSCLVKHLVDRKIILRDRTGRFLAGAMLQPKVRLLGAIQAGFPSPAEEELVDTLSLDEFLIRKPAASYLLRVTGDSMVEAGIQPGDLVIVERGKQPGVGDIVIAQVDGEWTMKYYFKQGKQIVLKAANPKYQPIKPKQELTVGGIVIACVRKYGR